MTKGCGHWGWGAVMVDTPPKGWVCPWCGQAQKRKERGRHTYLFDEPSCTTCAREWHDQYCESDHAF